jgi:hypothetical protein
MMGHYAGGSQYKRNLDQFPAALSVVPSGNGWFYKGSVGAGANAVFGLIIRFVDNGWSECLDRLSRAPARITTACPGSRSMNTAYNVCVLQYSCNADHDYEPLVSAATSNTSDAVCATWVPLMRKLTSGVATSLLWISNDSTPYWTAAGIGLDKDRVSPSVDPKQN